MKITKTRLTEIMMTQLYECSCNKTNDADGKTAGDLISFIIFCFEIISAFTEINHAQIVKRLYFSRGNIIEAGIKKMERTLYVCERTLFIYRRKYCKVIEKIFALIDDPLFRDLLNDL